MVQPCPTFNNIPDLSHGDPVKESQQPQKAKQSGMVSVRMDSEHAFK